MDPAAGMFRALIERCPMVTFVCDEQNRVTYISPQIEEWTGLPATCWTEDPTFWHTMLHPDDHDRVVSADFGGGTLDLEYRMRGRDGKWLWIWEHEVKVPGQGGSQGIEEHVQRRPTDGGDDDAAPCEHRRHDRLPARSCSAETTGLKLFRRVAVPSPDAVSAGCGPPPTPGPGHR